MAEYYVYMYTAVVFLLTLLKVNVYSRLSFIPMSQRRIEPLDGAVVLTILMIIFIGFRPISYVFTDMTGYTQAMVDGRFEGQDIRWDTNYLFQPMMAFLSSHGASKRTPIVILAIINFGATFIAMRKMFPKDVLIAMLVFFGAFSTFGAATNGLKAGCAAALFLVSLAYREKKLICCIFIFLSMGFHHSMQLPIVAFVLCSLYKQTKIYFLFWLLCFFISAAHLTDFMNMFESVTDEHGSIYFNEGLIREYEGKMGFRWDFILYSAMPLLLGHYFIFKKKITSEKYQFLLNLYLLVNAVWMLCMYAQFTNRIAYLSWLMYPVMIIYPFLNTKTGVGPTRLFRNVVIVHIGFTLFMQFIYYV